MNLEERINRINIEFLERDCKSILKNTVQPISKDEVCEIVRYLICQKEDYLLSATYSEYELIYEIIKLKKCDTHYAKRILNKMDLIGLNYCKRDFLSRSIDGTYTYNIISFAKMHNFANNQEIEDFVERMNH